MSKTEIKLEFLGVSGLNPFIANVSSPRAVMDFNHISQKLPLITPDEVLIKTGIEYEMGKYINDVRTDHDCVVKAIVPKYREYGIDSPVYSVFVEYEENGQVFIDYIDVDTHRSSHNFFGYKLHPTDAFKDLGYNSTIPKDTILAATDSLGKEGSYKYGLNANVAFMSHPSVAEDGFVVSESFVKRGKFHSIVKRTINITKDTIPLNINGTEDVYKFLPGIGEKVREDGLLCVTRQRNDWFSISDMNNQGLSELDAAFDTATYVNPNSTVLDITVVRGNYNKTEFTPNMTQQLDQYAEMLVNYYRNVVSKFDQILAEKKAMYGSADAVRLTPRLHRFITDSIIKVNMATLGKNKLSYRKLPIDQYRIEVTTISEITPNLGYKLTGIYGDKGVICRILPDDMMPVDELGNRAEVITDSMSTISRMNLGRSYQSYMGALSRDNRIRLFNHFANKYGPYEILNKVTNEDLDYFRTYMQGIYSHINSEMVEFLSMLNDQELHEHMKEVLQEAMYLYYPPDNENCITDVISNFEKSPFKPHLGKVSYVDELGIRVTTTEDVRIGQMYFLVLEKIGGSYSAVSSSKVNNFGFPVKGTNLDKHKYPHSLTPTTTLGETEVRILTSFASPEMIADMIDITLNPISHKLLIKNTLENNKAYDTKFDIDRNIVEYGNTKSLAILHHLFNAAGFDFAYEDEKPPTIDPNDSTPQEE